MQFRSWVVKITGVGPSQKWTVEWPQRGEDGQFQSYDPKVTSQGLSKLEISPLPGIGSGSAVEQTGTTEVAAQPVPPQPGVPSLVLAHSQLTLPELKDGDVMDHNPHTTFFYHAFLGSYRVRLPAVFRHALPGGGQGTALVVAAVYHHKQRRNELWAYRCYLEG